MKKYRTLLLKHLALLFMLGTLFSACTTNQNESSPPLTPLLDVDCYDQEWDDGVVTDNNEGGDWSPLVENHHGPFDWSYSCTLAGSTVNVKKDFGPHAQYSNFSLWEGVWHSQATTSEGSKIHTISAEYTDVTVCYPEVALTWYITDAAQQKTTMYTGETVYYPFIGPGEFRVDVEVREPGQTQVIANYIMLFEVEGGSGDQ